jgi:hypothetical protein
MDGAADRSASTQKVRSSPPLVLVAELDKCVGPTAHPAALSLYVAAARSLGRPGFSPGVQHTFEAGESVQGRGCMST